MAPTDRTAKPPPSDAPADKLRACLNCDWAYADQLLDEGAMAGAETWDRILNAIERLQAPQPAEGEKIH
jgi:hypothetical protein